MISRGSWESAISSFLKSFERPTVARIGWLLMSPVNGLQINPVINSIEDFWWRGTVYTVQIRVLSSSRNNMPFCKAPGRNVVRESLYIYITVTCVFFCETWTNLRRLLTSIKLVSVISCSRIFIYMIITWTAPKLILMEALKSLSCSSSLIILEQMNNWKKN